MPEIERAEARRALVIDDSLGIRERLSAILEGFGFTCDQAENGSAALRILYGTPRSYVIVFVDVEMPLVDGPTLLRILRARHYRTIPVLVTGTKDTKRLAATITLGAADYLPKPFDEADVRALLDRLYLLPSEDPSRRGGASKIAR